MSEEKLPAAPSERLPVMIDRAARRLATAIYSGEVLEAKKMADAALHYAKVTKAAAETQADCLRIITQAEMLMADQYDAAQKRGEIARDGQHGEAVLTSDSLGLDRRRVAEWRKTRDAGPRVVKMTIETALNEGRAPLKSDILRAVGAARPRRPDAVDDLIRDIRASGTGLAAASENVKREVVSAIGPDMLRLSKTLDATVKDYGPARESTGAKGAADRAEARAKGKPTSAAASAP